jgi:hypothetical protein
MGIEPHFDLWSHFFHVWLSQSAEAAVLGGADIYVKSRHGVNPYFHLSMSESTNGWWKVWFFLRNYADVPLPVFTGSRPIPHPNWGYGVARRDLRKVQFMHEVIQQLRWEGLMDMNLLQTFFSYRIQPLH